MKGVKLANLNNTDLDNPYFVVYSIEEGGTKCGRKMADC